MWQAIKQYFERRTGTELRCPNLQTRDSERWLMYFVRQMKQICELRQSPYVHWQGACKCLREMFASCFVVYMLSVSYTSDGQSGMRLVLG